MVRKYWIVIFFSLIFSSSLFANLDYALAQYQGTWTQPASDDTLSKVIIEHTHQEWLINVYKHCQENNDCLVASQIMTPSLVNGQLNQLTTFWRKQFPETKHVVLVYQLILTPADHQHMSWKIFVRDENDLHHLVTSMHGVLTRDMQQNVPDVSQSSKTVATQKTATRQIEQCQDIKVKCVPANNPTLTVGTIAIKQRQTNCSSGMRCLPFIMQDYDAKNIALLFQYNNLACSQQFSNQCAGHQCVAIIKNFNVLGSVPTQLLKKLSS